MVFRKELEHLKEYVPGKRIVTVMEEYGLTDIVKLASNENPLGTSPKAVEAIIKEASTVNLYPDPVCRDLVLELSKKCGVEPNQIMVGNGGEEILKLLATALVNEGEEVIANEPSFFLYEIAANIMGGTARKSKYDENFDIDVDHMLSLINEKTKMFCVCTPNNPTGKLVPFETIKRLVKEVPENVVLLLDEAYFDYAEVTPGFEDSVQLLNERENLCILRTFSKVAGLAGTRVGYLISNPNFIRQFLKVKSVFNVNKLAQAGALAALHDREFIEKTVELNYKSLALMEKAFDEMGLKYAKSSANFIWVNVEQDTRVVNEELLKRGIIIRPGFLWGHDSYLRVSTGTIEQTEKFISALREVLKK